MLAARQKRTGFARPAFWLRDARAEEKAQVMPGGTCHALQCFSLGLGPRVDSALIQDDWAEPGHAGRPTRPGSGQTMFLIGFPWMASGGGFLANPPTPTRRKTIGGRRGGTFKEENQTCWTSTRASQNAF